MTNNASYLASDTTYRTLSNALCSKETPEEDKSSIVKRMLSLSSDGNELYTSFCDARFAGANLNVILPLLNKASDLKYAPAEATLGSYYFDGVPDYEKAADLLESAIVDHNSFDTPAKRRLGQCYLEGLGREKNVEKAQEYIVNAASEGDADAKAFLKNNNFSLTANSTGSSSSGISPVPTAPSLQLDNNRKLWKLLVFTPLTLGIYGLVFFSKISTDIKTIASPYDHKKTMHYCLLVFLVNWITFGIGSLVWYHRLSERIGRECTRRNTGYHFGASTFWLWFVLGSLIVIGPFVYFAKLCKAMNLIASDYNYRG